MENAKQYDLEERTLQFAIDVKEFVKQLPKTLPNREYSIQLIRSSGSVGANYIEANEAVSKKDFLYRIKICRKEAKESRYWLRLTDTGNMPTLEDKRKRLIQESTEFMKMFSSIVSKSK